jgi:hypothetical protein
MKWNEMKWKSKPAMLIKKKKKKKSPQRLKTKA